MTPDRAPLAPPLSGRPGDLQSGVPATSEGDGLGGLLAGMADVWRAAGYLMGRPALWIWALLPFVINMLVFVGIAWGGYTLLSQAIGEWLIPGTWKAEAAAWIVGILFWLVYGVAVVFLFVPLAALIASPFNDILSEQVEKRYCGASVDGGLSLRAMVRAVTIGIHTSLRLALKTMGLLLVVFAIGFIPVIGAPLAAIASPAITIRFLALEFTSYSMDRRYYSYAQRKRFLRVNRWRTIGLGTMAFLIMLVPGLNALFIPVSAVAGTLLFCDAEGLRR